jgi:hypothetical protein
MSNYRPKTKPFKHQAKATIAAAKHRNYGLFFEPRLGKSKAALDYCGILALKGEVKRVVILAPRIAIQIWEGQIEKHYPYWYHAENFEEEWADERGIDSGLYPVVEFFLAGREETFRRVRVGRQYYRPKQDVLEKWKPDVVIVDESHEYKRPGGVGAQDCWRMIQRLRKRSANGKPYVLLLSGTPNPNGWLDLFAPFRIMDQSIFGTNVADFKEDHVVYGHGRRKWTILKYRGTRSLERKVRAHSVTVHAEEAGLANVQFFESISVRLPDRVKMMYLELVEEFMTEWEGGLISAKNSGVRRIRLLQLCGGFTTEGEQIHDEKVKALGDYTRILFEQGESALVYSRFTPEVEAATESLAKVGFRTFRVDGQVSRRDRRRATDSLLTRPKEPTAISFQVQAGSRALELVGAAETIYYSPPDGWVDYYQSLKRIQGPNQSRPVRYTHLLARGTVDISVVRNLQNKEDAHAHLFRNPRRYLTGI